MGCGTTGIIFVTNEYHMILDFSLRIKEKEIYRGTMIQNSAQFVELGSVSVAVGIKSVLYGIGSPLIWMNQSYRCYLAYRTRDKRLLPHFYFLCSASRHDPLYKYCF